MEYRCCRYSGSPSGKGYKLIFLPNYDTLNIPQSWKGAAGYHSSIDYNAYVDCGKCEPLGITTRVASHEVLEVLSNDTASKTGYELADPVNNYGYFIDGIEMSDFIYPSYFIRGSLGPWDFMHVVTNATVPAPGGYNNNPIL